MTLSQYPEWVYLTVYLALPYSVTIYLASALGAHKAWCRDVIRRQWLEVFSAVAGVILPAVTYGFFLHHALAGILVFCAAPIPLILVYRLELSRYRKWLKDEEFRRYYGREDDGSPVIRHRAIR